MLLAIHPAIFVDSLFRSFKNDSLFLKDLNVSENANLVMPPKHTAMSEAESKAALFYNIDFSVAHQLAKAKLEQKGERVMSQSSSVDSVSGSFSRNSEYNTH